MLKIATSSGLEPIAQGGLPRAMVGPVQVGAAQRGCTPLAELFQGGHMLELSGQKAGKLSAVVRLITRAQAEGEPVVWVTLREQAGFYPPDFAQAGVDLAALVVVRLAESAGSHAVVRVAEVLLRSGAFGLVIIDFVGGVPRGELSWQSRLSGLLRRHDARAVLLTSSAREEPSLGPLVSLRVEPSWQVGPGKRVVLSQQLLKSKLGSPVSVSPDTRQLPAGASGR